MSRPQIMHVLQHASATAFIRMLSGNEPCQMNPDEQKPQTRSELLDSCFSALKVTTEGEKDAQLDALAGLSFVFGNKIFVAIQLLEQQQVQRAQSNIFCVGDYVVSSQTWTCDCESFVVEFTAPDQSGDAALDPLRPCFCEHILAVALGLTKSSLFPPMGFKSLDFCLEL